MKRKIYSLTLIKMFENAFKNQHSKFIHGSPLRLEDLGRSFEDESGRILTLVGLNDSNLAVLHEEATNFYFVIEPKDLKEMTKGVLA